MPVSLRVRLRRILVGTIVVVVGTVALTWLLDYGVFHIRVAANWGPYGSVVVNHYYAIPQKSGKTQFVFDPPAPQTCVNALFPHSGWLPCWYLSRRPDQRTNM